MHFFVQTTLKKIAVKDAEIHFFFFLLTKYGSIALKFFEIIESQTHTHGRLCTHKDITFFKKM